MEIVERCTFSLDQLKYQYPHEVVSPAHRAANARAPDLGRRYEALPEGYPTRSKSS
jgi:hypothetical protein